MRVVHVMRTLELAEGAIAAARGMVQAQRRAGIDSAVVYTTAGGSPAPFVASGINVAPFADWARGDTNADVIHAHGLWDRGLPSVGRIAKRRGTPLVVSPHGMATGWALAQGRLKKLAYRHIVLGLSWPADLTMHFATQWERERSMRWSPHQRAVVVPLCVDAGKIVDASRGAEGFWRQRIGDGPPTLVFVGRVHPGKGVEYLVPAMRQVPREVGRLAVVGPNKSGFADELRRQAGVLGVADRVHWVGPVYAPELYAAMADAAAVVLPSDHENFGLVAVEALAAGAPALLSREVAIGAELVESGAAGWVSREPNELGAELLAFLTDGAFRVGLASRTAQSVERFSLKGVGDAWAAIYDKLSRSSGAVS